MTTIDLQTRLTVETLRRGYRLAIEGLKFHDPHVHIASPCTGDSMALFGLPQAGAYHYLDGEAASLSRRTRAQQKAHASKTPMERALANLDAIMGSNPLGIPVSTAACGWFRMAKALGLDSSAHHSEILREWDARFGKMSCEAYYNHVIDLSRVTSMTGTQSIFLPGETSIYLDDKVLGAWDPSRFRTAIRFDEALRRPDLLSTSSNLAGFHAAAGQFEHQQTQSAIVDMASFFINRFRTNARAAVEYLSASMGAEDTFYNPDGSPAKSRFATVVRDAMIPLAKKEGLPIFLMPFVTRGVNPDGGSSGDCVASGNIDDLIRFISENPDVHFIVTTLHPAHDYNLCFAARALSNLTIIGFWWGNLNRNEVRRQIQQRLEFTGLSWFGLNSDARIVDQILYKWEDYLDDLEYVLCEIILPQALKAGRVITPASIRELVRSLQDEKKLIWTPLAA